MKRLILAAAAAGLIASPAQAAERADAQVTCKETSKELVFDCTIMLTGRKSKVPLQGASITVKADMSSMPMAHNVRPVKAKPMAKSSKS